MSSKFEIGKCLFDVGPLFIQEASANQEGLNSMQVL